MPTRQFGSWQLAWFYLCSSFTLRIKWPDPRLDDPRLDMHCDPHLLILNLRPPTRRNPDGIHHAISEMLADEEYKAPSGNP